MTGSGTLLDPFVIYDVTDLQAMKDNLDAYYELHNDIDASAGIKAGYFMIGTTYTIVSIGTTDFTLIGAASNTVGVVFIATGAGAGTGTAYPSLLGFAPIGYPEAFPFTGHFDGKGYTITSLFINRPLRDGNGLFCATDKTGGTGYGVIQNVTLASVNITGKGFTGALVGIQYGEDITNCHSSGSVTGYSDVGGLIGQAYGGDVIRCTSSCTVIATAPDAGGLIGQAAGPYDTGFYGDSNAVRYCYATGNVTSTRDFVGGLIGCITNYATNTEQCFATGNVVGRDYVGSFSGSVVTYEYLRNCYARGSVTGRSYVGGFAGYNYGTVYNCYSTGLVSGLSDVGGFCGLNDDTITDCFWDTQTSGTLISDGGTGKTTAEMKNSVTFISAGWNFGIIWGMTVLCNDGYACLLNVTPNCAWAPPTGRQYLGDIHVDQLYYQHAERMDKFR